MPESERGGGGKEEKVGIYTHVHINTHSHTSHTFRRGRRRADMKSCHLEKKRGRRGREGGMKKNLQHSPRHHVHSEGESWEDALVGGRGRKCTNRPPTLPFSYSIDTHAVPELYPAPKMRFYYSVELYTAA